MIEVGDAAFWVTNDGEETMVRVHDIDETTAWVTVEGSDSDDPFEVDLDDLSGPA